MKLFRIYESDLQILETALPTLQDALMPMMNDPKIQATLGEVKEILSNVRWDYGPPSEVHCIPVGGIDK